MGTRASIYARNIIDRYPNLPRFLLIRLTQASCVRAAKLSFLREQLNRIYGRPHSEIRSKRNVTEARFAGRLSAISKLMAFDKI